MKRACEGARKRPPPHTKRPWTQRVRGSLAPQATKDADKIPKKGAANMPPPKNGPSPGSHSSEEWVRLPSGLVRPPPVYLEKVWPQNEKGEKEKQNKRNTRRPLPPRVPRKKASEGPRRIPKTPGAQNGTPEKRQEAGRTAKTGGTEKSGGTQKRQRTRKTGACEGVSCYYLIYIS